MKRLLLTATAILFLAVPAIAQAPDDMVPLSISRATLQIVGQGLMELPYKTAAGPLATLQQQLNAHDEATRAAQIEAARKATEAAKAKEPAKDQEKAPETTPTPAAK